MSFIREVTIEGRTIKFEFQKYAKQANGSVLISCEGTQVLVTVCAEEEKVSDNDFFPLGVDYIEKSYAAGRIPGGYAKREGKPSESATLLARVIDRPLRPCFPDEFQNETVITATVLSYEHGYSPAPLAVLGASAALMVSEIPFNGPVAAVRLGMKNGAYIFDPLEGGDEGYDLDLNIACKRDAVLMVEAGANMLSETQMLDAINHAHKLMEPLFDLQEEVQKAIGKTKWTIPNNEPAEELTAKVREYAEAGIRAAFLIASKPDRNKALKSLYKETCAHVNPENDGKKGKQIAGLYSNLKATHMRRTIIEEGRRIDGRTTTQIRPISCEVGLLKKPHGSALFTRGETQALACVTLAAAEDQQRNETLWSTDLKDRFMLHYNFPPFSVGEARMQRSPGRREIGHGNLAKRALIPVMPHERDFGYTIRVVSETLESNGSSSMATVCSGTMALLQAGVPLKAPVAGIAMGLIKEGDSYAILSDILGDEDHLGDMDFKVCGTKDGITALQMDIKIAGITPEIMKNALEQAKEGRLHILGHLTRTIQEPAELSDTAPRIFKVKIKADKIRDLIGPNGKTIKRITSESGAKIDIDERGIINIVAPDALSAQAAKALIRSYTSNPLVGEIYLGKVIRVVDFGAFIEIRPGTEGLCHITQWDESRVPQLDTIVKEGDDVMVKIVDIDKQGRIKLSRKDALGQKPTMDSTSAAAIFSDKGAPKPSAIVENPVSGGDV